MVICASGYAEERTATSACAGAERDHTAGDCHRTSQGAEAMEPRRRRRAPQPPRQRTTLARRPQRQPRGHRRAEKMPPIFTQPAERCAARRRPEAARDPGRRRDGGSVFHLAAQHQRGATSRTRAAATGADSVVSGPSHPRERDASPSGSPRRVTGLAAINRMHQTRRAEPTRLAPKMAWVWSETSSGWPRVRAIAWRMA